MSLKSALNILLSCCTTSIVSCWCCNTFLDFMVRTMAASTAYRLSLSKSSMTFFLSSMGGSGTCKPKAVSLSNWHIQPALWGTAHVCHAVTQITSACQCGQKLSGTQGLHISQILTLQLAHLYSRRNLVTYDRNINHISKRHIVVLSQLKTWARHCPNLP